MKRETQYAAGIVKSLNTLDLTDHADTKELYKELELIWL